MPGAAPATAVRGSRGASMPAGENSLAPTA